MKVIIIGAQGGGMTAAAKLKRNLPDTEIILFEASEHVSFGACGLPYFIGNFFTEESNMFAKSVAELEETGLKIFIKHMVLSIDEKAQSVLVKNLETNQEFSETYDKLIIATGSSARDREICNNHNTFTVKTLEDAHALKYKLNQGNIKSISILGAGYIGLELLEAFREYGNIKEINIIDIKHNISDNLIDDDFESDLEKELKKHDINIYLKTTVNNINNSGTNVVINATDKHHKEIEILSDILIVSKGFIPNTQFLSNVPFEKLENGALLIDKVGKTNIPNIYAVGDCASVYHKIIKKDVYIPLATIANKMARVVADDISGMKSRFVGALGSSCLKVLDLEIGKTGITEFEAKKHKIPYNKTFVQDYNHTNYYPNNYALFMKVLTDPETHTIMGAQIMGKKNTLLRIHALSVAVETGLHIEDLGMLDFAYAPPFTRTWEALNILGNVGSVHSRKKIKNKDKKLLDT